MKFYKYEIQLLSINGDSDQVLNNLYDSSFHFIQIYQLK